MTGIGRVFVLGAGASCFAGYPLGLDLWSFVRDNGTSEVLAKRRAEEVIEGIERVLKVVPPREHDRPDLEQLFTLLDLAEMGAEPLQLVKLDWSRLRPMLTGMIADVFQWHEYQLQTRLREAANGTALVLNHWASRVQEGDMIVSFNWDLMHEAALWRWGKWHYSDGYGFTCRDAPKGCHSKVRMLKLHGSVNWAQRDEQDCEPAIEHKADFFPSAQDDHDTYSKRRGQWNEGRYLIVPSYLKDLSANTLLLRLWNQAFDALSTARQVIVIGFQLNRADALARQLLGCALTRNVNPVALQIVSPSHGIDHWDEFCNAIGKDRTRFE